MSIFSLHGLFCRIAKAKAFAVAWASELPHGCLLCARWALAMEMFRLRLNMTNGGAVSGIQRRLLATRSCERSQ